MIAPNTPWRPQPERNRGFDASTGAAAANGRIFGLDALRAAAILGVVLAHGFAVLYPHAPHLGLLGHGGFYGVELFFVLSGFLIGQILIELGGELRQTGSLAVFYTRRWFRTLPLFWLFLFVNVALEFFLRNHRPPAAEVAGHGLFLRTFGDHRLTFFAESWSLAIEEWFYLLFPAALWLGLRCTKHFDRVFLVATAAFYLWSTTARVLSATEADATWHTWQRMVVVLRFDALMIGVAAAWVALRFPAGWQRWAKPCAIAGGALLLVMYVTLWSRHRGYFVASADSFFARTFRFNLVSLGFALLLPAASAWTLRRESAGASAVRKIALWSYSMYLVHLPVYQLAREFLFRGWQTSAPQAIALFSLQLAVTIALSAALFRFFESPCTRQREKIGPRIARWFRAKTALSG